MLLLLLLMLAWRALRVGHDISGGIWLGSALLLKLMGWPIVLFLLWQRRWRSVTAIALVGVAGHLLTAAFIGVDGVRRYYTEVGPTVSALYRGFDANFSAWTWGQRFFGGMAAPFINGIMAPPLVVWPLGTRVGAVLAPCVVLVAGLWLSLLKVPGQDPIAAPTASRP